MDIKITSPKNLVTELKLGTSSPRLSGSVDITSFPNLQKFTCIGNDINAVTGYENNSKIVLFDVFDNKITGTIPSLSGMTKLDTFNFYHNQLTGSIPSLSGLTLLRTFNCSRNILTGYIPSLSFNTKLVNFVCNLNQLTGSIPNLSELTLLQIFNCSQNQLTGFAGGSVSNTLGEFYAQNNQLTSTAVNDILAAFVAANRTTGKRTLILAGTGNAAPTGQGLIDKETLISRDWKITTN